MFEKVKISLRVSGNDLDGEIADLIESAKADLKLASVVNISDDDPLIIRAVSLYAKAHCGYADDSEKYLKSYTRLKCILCLAGGYNAVE